MNDSYLAFLEKKKPRFEGQKIPYSVPNSSLFPFQSYAVSQALKGGRYALFEDCGLGKTLQQIEWANNVCHHKGGRAIILAPLAVRIQTQQEIERFGYDADRFDVVNYESAHKYSPESYDAVVLDESSILKNFSGKMRTYLTNEWIKPSFRLACTATPAPNDFMELGNHSEFLGAMTRSQMLSMFFVHDGGAVQNWRLKGHARDRFFEFMSTWSLCAGKPSDLGDFDDMGYNLPGLHIHDVMIKTANRGGSLFNDVAVSATDYNQELRRTMDGRLEKAAEIANAQDTPCIVWCKHNAESTALTKMIDGACEVTGSDSPERKEELLMGFAKGDFKVLVTKPKIAQYGLNYQHCPAQIFASLDFSFEGLYQAIRRSYRFGQKSDVNIWLIITDSMQNVQAAVNRKMQDFESMREEFTKIQSTQR